MIWPPETVDTPMGVQPFDQAVRWHLPTVLRWIIHNRDASRAPDGTLVGEVLRAAAETIERRAPHPTPASDEACRRHMNMVHYGHSDRNPDMTESEPISPVKGDGDAVSGLLDLHRRICGKLHGPTGTRPVSRALIEVTIKDSSALISAAVALERAASLAGQPGDEDAA